MDDRKKHYKQYQRRWRRAYRTLRSQHTHANIAHFEDDSSDSESSSKLVHYDRETIQSTGLTVPTIMDSFSVIDCYLIEPMTVSVDIDKSASSQCDIMTLLSYLPESSSESDEDQLSGDTLKQGLALWVNECSIPHSAVNKLLQLLQCAGHKLPSTATSLLETIKEVPVTTKSNMDYVYFNTEKQLTNFYSSLSIDSKVL